ncbi:zinc metalloprotease [Panacibacter sp. DH6]|uniref:Zinc metalloprotease n=1 Tax=Panacibacter microcysteis TaxID=2793269 RepID=A0A931E4H8_9BACT|nr:zinc metalloprotease [Panacibacter microcysteis]MBG9376893.1 zinc metalloprotease [Panacibacter microcysteis]
MKLKIEYFTFAILLYGCTSTPKEEALSKVNDYNEALEQIVQDSMARIDTVSINEEFNKIEMPSILEQTMTEISDEISFKKLLRTERNLLNKWEPIKGYQSYFGIKPDTLLGLLRRCGTLDRAPSDAERLPSAGNARTVSLDYYRVEVPVAFHIIANRKGIGLQGNMLVRINDQIKAMNMVYSKFNITFKLNSIDTTTNDVWFNNASVNGNLQALVEMTKALSNNPTNIMNVYTLSLKNLGEATFPWDVSKGTPMDYVLINYNTLSGGPETFFNGMYNEGKTLIHEVGHFLGLLHTFEGGNPNIACDSDLNNGCNTGDQVDDTPPQKICYFYGCNVNENSCPAPGNDPVKNFMGYNPDACMSELTSGQGDRLKQGIIKFRYYLIINPA